MPTHVWLSPTYAITKDSSVYTHCIDSHWALPEGVKLLTVVQKAQECTREEDLTQNRIRPA